MSEGWGDDAFVSLTTVANRTQTIRYGTAGVNAYSRTPPIIEMIGATLQRLSGGRALLGVGPSNPSFVETLHSMIYDQPIRWTHETIELLKQLTDSSDEITYNGQVFRVIGYPRFDTPLPTFNAALD